MDRNVILAERRGVELTYGILVDALLSVGINKGDTICVHSDLPKFGRAKIERGKYEKAFIDGLLELIGSEGTLIMPTFSYSFCKGEVFDVQNTPSDVGVLTEYFRKLPGVKRTAEPIFSFAVSGKNMNYYMETGKDCLSEDSMYGKLLKNKAKTVYLGSTKGKTFVHFIEEQAQVPYRFMKRFTGKIIDDGKEYETYRDYYVRYLDRNSSPDDLIIDKFLIDKDIMSISHIGKATISLVECDRWYKEVIDIYKNSPEYFLLKEF